MAIDMGSRIVELRGERGLSQEALANELGLSRQAVSRWERGEALPDTENLIALASLFGVTLDELVRPAGTTDEGAAVDVRRESGRQDGPAPTTPGEPGREEAPAAPDAPAAPEEPDAQEAPNGLDEDEGPSSTDGETPGQDQAGTAGLAPEPTATIPPPRPPWQKALLALALVASVFVSAQFIAAVVTYVVHSGPAEEATLVGPAVDVDGSQVSSLDVIWGMAEAEVLVVDDAETAGNVRIQATSMGQLPDDIGFQWELEGGRLRVACSPTDDSGGVTLYIEVPMSVAANLKELSLEASGEAFGFANGLTCDKIYVYSAWGNVQVDNCEAKAVDVHAISGGVWLSGIYGDVSVDASGNGDVHLEVGHRDWMPASIDARLSESTLSLLVPQEAGFTVSPHKSTVAVETELDLVHGKDGAVHGTGETRIALEGDGSEVSITGFDE